MQGLKILFLLVALVCAVNGYKILVVSPVPGKSHSILGDGLVRHLVQAGHEVAYVTAVLPKKPHPNVTVVDVSKNFDIFEPVRSTFVHFEAIMNNELGLFKTMTMMKEMLKMVSGTIENPNMLKVMANDRFDVVVAEWMFSDIYSGLGAVFDCPFIWFSPCEPHWRVLRMIDEIPNPAYTADMTSSARLPFSFLERVKQLGLQIFGLVLKKTYFDSLDNTIYNNLIAPIIQKKGKTPPPFEILKFNASLMLGNSHISLGVPFRMPDSYKPIGGFHIDNDIKPLPKDLKDLLDNAKNGLIYFSMGSNLKSKTLPNEVKQSLLKMFGELKQTVLWKFEEDLPNRPSNVHIVQWAPQPSILAHPNCILFITHGGQLSTTETVHYGVPIVGIPVFADQYMNVMRSVQKGFAKKVDLSYTMVNQLKQAINDVLSDPSYRTKAKELSFIYHDRPSTPGKDLVHWVEHVIKTRGAPHLRSPALDVSWYQKIYLDLLILLVVLGLGTTYFIKIVISKIRKTENRRNESKKRN